MNIKATGLITKSSSGDTLDAYFPVIQFNDQKTDIQNNSLMSILHFLQTQLSLYKFHI